MASVSKREWVHKGETKTAWVLRYKDPSGAHRSRQFSLKKQADEFRRKVERELDDGTHIARRQSLTVSALVDEFLGDLSRRLNEGQVSQSYYTQQELGLRYAIPFIGNVTVADLRWQHVETYIRQLRTRTSKTFKRPLSNGTIRVALDALARALGYAVRRSYAARNAAQEAKKELGSMPSKEIETFSISEMRAIIEAIETPTSRGGWRGQAMLRAIVYLGCMCGLRRGEIMALRWEDIDFKGARIMVRHSLRSTDQLAPPKTAKGKRVVPMARMVAEALDQWRPFVVAEPRGLIFRTKHGGIIRASDFYMDLWHKVLTRAGLPRKDHGFRHFHATRHFAGSAWLNAQVPLPEVSRLLGHANVAITARVYSHAIEEISLRADILDRCATALTSAAPKSDAHGLRMIA